MGKRRQRKERTSFRKKFIGHAKECYLIKLKSEENLKALKILKEQQRSKLIWIQS